MENKKHDREGRAEERDATDVQPLKDCPMQVNSSSKFDTQSTSVKRRQSISVVNSSILNAHNLKASNGEAIPSAPAMMQNDQRLPWAVCIAIWLGISIGCWLGLVMILRNLF